MSHYIVKLSFLIAGIINLLPLMGVLSRGRLEKHYKIKVNSPDLEILMRHRAVLFGIVGGFLIAAAFKVDWQVPAIAAGLISMVSFILLTMMVSGYSGTYRHIVMADFIGIAALIIAAAFLGKTP